MRPFTEITEPKRLNKVRIAKFISSKGSTSKSEIARELKLSMPTVLQNVKELIETGVVTEDGEYQSTGGRKAKALTIVSDLGYTIGIDITGNHITLVLVNMGKEIVMSERIRKPFRDEAGYYEFLRSSVDQLLEQSKIERTKIIGVGFSLPGIVDKDRKTFKKTHVLKVQDISFKNFGDSLGFPYAMENDANSAAYAELNEGAQNTAYLSLSNTVGGAIYLHGEMYQGENFKSAEFGHIIIKNGGRTCYCGKKGCMDPYCSAKLLQEYGKGNLELFFDKVKENDRKAVQIWDEYLEYLAIAVTNLRMVFDCNIVLGGYVGGYLDEFMPELSKKMEKYNNFETGTTYLQTGKYKLEASAYGITLGFVDAYLNGL